MLVGHVQRSLMQASVCSMPYFFKHSKEVALADLTGTNQGVEVGLLIAARAAYW